ncbi:MAG: hypothetical protein LBE78_05105 [Burkholderiaceae bacterium]|jgi:hypothetical protein|nr:hypothetical protein [Burkholderiaceae bacterium]
MKPVLLFVSCLTIAAACAPARAQERVYRCANNEYTNQIKGRTGCQLVKNDGITIINSAPARTTVQSGASSASAPVQQRINVAAQRARDADARAILEQELRRTEARQAELEKEYNSGQPDKIGGEAKNYQKYLDRVAEMKAAIERNKSDIEGIKRELARYTAPVSSNP